MLNEIDINYKPVAAEIFSAAWCNLDCTYCYIPKHNTKISEKHADIIKEIKAVDPIIDRLKNIYGEHLEVISHWGSEPSLTLHLFDNFYKKAIETFPKLNAIMLSSNFIENTERVTDFILNFPKEKQFTFTVQMSLDGPKWITDSNRRGGATDDIISNIVQFVENINKNEDIFHKVNVHFKPTVTKEQFTTLLDNNGVFEYFSFFDDVCFKLSEANKFNNVQINFDCSPTIVCPDEYTQQDGINLNIFYNQILELKTKNIFKVVVPELSYYWSLVRLCKHGREFTTKHSMFTCSAGDSQFGISEYLNPCHDTFYHPYNEMKDAVKKDSDRINSNHEKENVERGRFELTKRVYNKKIDSLSEKDYIEYIYNLRAFHDFTKFKTSASVAVIKELAYAGLVSSCYKQDKMAELLGTFVNTRHSCPTGNVQNLGSKHLNNIAYFKLFGNGLFENFLKRYIEENL